MVEPVTVVCGVLYAGLGSMLWKAAGTAADGFIGNRADAMACLIGQTVQQKLLARRGLAENHDIARALRQAQITSLRHVLKSYERSTGPNPPVRFLQAVGEGLDRAENQLKALKWNEDLEAAMFASFQQAFRTPVEKDDPVEGQARISEQVSDLAWKELQTWAGDLQAPGDFQRRFFGQRPGGRSWFDYWCGEVAEALKNTPRFKNIFFADKLVEIGDLALDGAIVLARIEDQTEAAREDIVQLQDHLDRRFDELEAKIVASLERAQRPDTGGLSTDAKEAVSEVVKGDVAEQEAARLIAENRVEEGFNLLRTDARDSELQALTTVAEKWRRIGAMAAGINVAVALEAYTEAARLSEKDCWTWIFVSRFARVAGSLGEAYKAAKNAERWADHPRKLACAIAELGQIAEAEGDLPAARKASEASLEICNQLANRNSSTDSQLRDLGISYERLGDIAAAQGHLSDARTAYQEGSEICEALAKKHPNNLSFKRDLSIRASKQGHLSVIEEDLPAARLSYKHSLDLCLDLVRADPSSTSWQRDLSVNYNKVGDVALAEGDTAFALKCYQKSLDIRKALVKRDPTNTEWARDLCVSFDHLGDVARVDGDLPAAREAHLSSLKICRDLAERDPRNAQWRRDVWTSLWRLAADNESGVTWANVHEAIQAMKVDGVLAPPDEKFLAEAKRLAAPP